MQSRLKLAAVNDHRSREDLRRKDLTLGRLRKPIQPANLKRWGDAASFISPHGETVTGTCAQ